MKKFKITIEGMHCASCASNAERALKGVKGVISAPVSVMTKKAFVEAEDNVKEEELKKAIEKVGYKIIKVE